MEDGLAQYRAGAFRDALPLLEAAVAIQPANGELAYSLADVQQKIGRPADAAATYQRFLDANPTHASAWEFTNALAANFQSRGRSAEAIALYERFLTTHLNHQDARNSLAFLAKRTRSYDRYLPELQRIVANEHELIPTGAIGAEPLAMLQAHGMVVLRQAIDLDRLAPLGTEARWQAQAARLQNIPLDRLIAADRLVELVPISVRALLTQLFGREPNLRPDECFFRRVHPGAQDSLVPFHQDSTAFNRPGVNLWVPLRACGATAPGLQLVGTRLAEALETLESYDFHEIDAALVEQRFGAHLMAPQLEPGDAILFLSSTIHRSFVTPTMTEPRESLEIRFD